MAELEKALVRIEADTTQLKAALNSAKADVGGFTKNAASNLDSARGGFTRFGSAAQQAGYQVGDFFVQVGSGQGVMRPLLQQGTQLISMFGPWGAVLGAAGAAVGALVVSFGGFETAQERVKKNMDALDEALRSASSVMDEHIRIGASLVSQNEAEAQSTANLARWVQSLTADMRDLEQARLSLRQLELQEAASKLVPSVNDIVNEGDLNKLKNRLNEIKGIVDNLRQSPKALEGRGLVGAELRTYEAQLEKMRQFNDAYASIKDFQAGDGSAESMANLYEQMVKAAAEGGPFSETLLKTAKALEKPALSAREYAAQLKQIKAQLEAMSKSAPELESMIAADPRQKDKAGSTGDGSGGNKKADAIARVNQQLEFQIAQLGRSERELLIYNNLQAAGVQIDQAAGRAIAAKSATLYDAIQLSKEDAEAMSEMERAMLAAISADEQRNKKRLETLASYEREISDNEKLAAALMVGNQAYAEEAMYLEIVNRLKADGSELSEQELEQARNISKTIVAQRADIERLRESTDFFGKVGERAFERIGDEATRMWTRGQGDALKWRNVVGGVISEVYQEMLKLTIFNPMKSALSGAISGGDLLGGLSNLFGGSGATGMGDWGFTTTTAVAHGGGDVGLGTGRTASVPSSVFSGAKRYHSGVMNLGINEVPIIAEKGERIQTVAQQRAQARQISDLRARAYQIPTMTRGAPSGGNSVIVNQTMNVQAGVSQTVRAEMMAMLPQIKKETEAAVAARVARGGSYASNFRR